MEDNRTSVNHIDVEGLTLEGWWEMRVGDHVVAEFCDQTWSEDFISFIEEEYKVGSFYLVKID